MCVCLFEIISTIEQLLTIEPNAGPTAWQLLSRLAGQHLTHLAPLAPPVVAALRAHLDRLEAISQMDRGGSYGARPILVAAPDYRPAAPVLPPPLPPAFARLLGGSPATEASAVLAPAVDDVSAVTTAAVTPVTCSPGPSTPRGYSTPPVLQGERASEFDWGSPGRLVSSPSTLSIVSSSSALKATTKLAAATVLGGRGGDAADRGGAIKAGRGARQINPSYAVSRGGQGKQQQQVQQQLQPPPYSQQQQRQPAGLLPQPQAARGERRRSLSKPGGAQWETVHSAPVMAVATSNHVVVTTSIDGTLKASVSHLGVYVSKSY